MPTMIITFKVMLKVVHTTLNWSRWLPRGLDAIMLSRPYSLQIDPFKLIQRFVEICSVDYILKTTTVIWKQNVLYQKLYILI